MEKHTMGLASDLAGVEIECVCGAAVMIPPGGNVPATCFQCRQRLYANEGLYHTFIHTSEALKSLKDAESMKIRFRFVTRDKSPTK